MAKKVVLGVAILLLGGCGGDGTGPADVVPAALAATWVAEPACLPQCGFTLSSVANPADSINVTAYAGISTEITMTRQGTFLLRLRPGPDTASTASVRVEPGVLIVTDAGGVTDTLDYTLAGDGTNDPAHARGSFRRR
jgi:hypothetical protein